MRLPPIIVTVFFATISVTAQEYWFESDRYFVNLRESTSVHLFVGTGLKTDVERPFEASKTRSFKLVSPTGNFDMRTMADDARSPIVKFLSDTSGTFMLLMDREWVYSKLDADKFEMRLRDLGTDYIIAERKRLGESKNEGRERSSGFLKMMVQVGDDRTGNVKTRIGSKLEIVPIDNPYSKKAGGNAAFQFWFDDRVLTDYTVFVDNRDGNNVVTRKLTTDSDGKAIVKLDRKGTWLVRVAYMQRCQRNCKEADWESFWGALSFGIK